MLLTLALFTFIVGVKAQDICTAASHQCCWVVRSWQLMGKSIPTGVSSSGSSCCTKPMVGVTCDSTNTAIQKIYWPSKTLTGSIPSELGNLRSLRLL